MIYVAALYDMTDDSRWKGKGKKGARRELKFNQLRGRRKEKKLRRIFNFEIRLEADNSG